MSEVSFGFFIFDSRPCAAKRTRILLGLGARIYWPAWELISFESFMKQFPEVSEEEIRKTLDDLISKKTDALFKREISYFHSIYAVQRK